MGSAAMEFNWGSSWTHDLLRVHSGLKGGAPGYAIDDLAALLLFPAFIAIQARATYQIHQQVKARRRTTLCSADTSSTKFGVANVVLFAGYCISSILFICGFAFKLSLLSNGLDTSDGRVVSRWLDLAAIGSAHLVILVADALLVYRCYIACHGKLYVWGSALLVTLLSAGILLTSCVFIGRGRYIADPLRTVLFHGRIVCSVLVNLIVTLAIAARLREAEQELRRISSVSGTPYKAAFCIFLDSALPPTIVGVLICVAIIPLEHYFPDRPIYTHWITVLWYSFTVYPIPSHPHAAVSSRTLQALAPQLIAVRVLKGQSWESPATETSPVVFHRSRVNFKSESSAEQFHDGSMTEVGESVAHGGSVCISIPKPHPRSF
ncbi:hypothetical protein BKA70DRAFT_1232312 [Coprinopsis sp. MPI-PUGE-AT-0042]|nr:hypothetical protein BKA70DRAFT_1232312 [Coprinopsis sp. MPI-PUGE-AT-0042]